MLRNRMVWRGLVAACVACLMSGGAQASAARWQDGWPTLTKMAPGQIDGAGFSVDIAQYLLRSRGFWVAADGNFGARSVQATRRFQISRGLAPTGVLGAATWRRLVPTVKPGSRGDAVRAVQVVLHEGDHRVPVDGIFGPVTRRAVAALQRESELAPDGVVGPATWRILLRDIYD